jgi:hypothetical protein
MKFMDKINSVNEYKDYIMKSEFWANSMSISIIEKELNIKIIILSEREYNDKNMRNVLQCGGDPIEEKDKLMCPICGLTNKEREYCIRVNDKKSINLLKRTLLKHGTEKNDISNNNIDYDGLIKLYYNLPDLHRFEIVNSNSNSNKDFRPDTYVIVTHSGNHYRLVSYRNLSYFKTLNSLPDSILELIKKQCTNTGLYKKIKGIGR